eukprot:6276140-Karenia_brevis.AAC.1
MTQERLSKAKISQSNVCPYCDANVPETEIHLWWECAAWPGIRERWSTPWFAFRDCWPKCLQSCGIMPESHPALAHLCWSWESSEDETEHPVTNGTSEPPARTEELWVNGRVVVFTDGACRHNQDARLRRAGYGAYWAHGHNFNVSAPLKGWSQTNQRAELQALVAAVEIESRPMEVRSDSKFVVNGFARRS